MNHTVEYDILHQNQLKKSLSGSQIDSLLNYFLFQALTPILQTLWFKNQLVNVVNVLLRDLKCRVTRKDKKTSLKHIMNAVSSLDRDDIILQLKSSSLDKSIFSEIINTFCIKTTELMEQEENFFSKLNNKNYDLKSSTVITNIEEEFNLSRTFLIKVGKEVKFWFDRYIEFRNLIVGKYIRLAYKYAKITKLNRPNIDMQCFFKSLVLSINTALDKYTPDRGTLTSYIQLWFKSTMVNPKYDFEMGRPFKLSNYAKQKMIDTGRNPNSISTDSEEFNTIENQLDDEFLNNKLEFMEVTNYDLLKFLNSVENSDIDLVKIVLNIPELV